MPLDFHGICANTSSHERLRLEINIFDLFESCKLYIFSDFVQQRCNFSPDCKVLADFFESSLYLQLISQLHQIFFVRDSNADNVTFSWISVNEDLSECLTFKIGIFNFLGRNVLSLL